MEGRDSFQLLEAPELAARKTQLDRARQGIREMARARQQDPSAGNQTRFLQLNHLVKMPELERSGCDGSGVPTSRCMGVIGSDRIASTPLLVGGEVEQACAPIPRGSLQFMNEGLFRQSFLRSICAVLSPLMRPAYR